MRVGFFQKDDTINRIRMVDHLVGEGSEGLPEIITKVSKKPYAYGKHFGPHDLEATDIGTGKTRTEMAKGLGLNFTLVPEYSLEDGINATYLWLDKIDVNQVTCKKWVKSMKSYEREWDEKRGMYKDEPLHNWASHDADMSRYAALSEHKMTNDNQFNPNRPFYDRTVEIWNNGQTT